MIESVGNCIISLDIGTTNIKAFAYSELGNVLASISAHIAEQESGLQDAVKIYIQCADILKQINKQLGIQSMQPYCLSLSGAMHSMLPVNNVGKPLAPAMIWANNSGLQVSKDLVGTDLAWSIYKETGTPIHPMSPLIKIAWMKLERGDIFRQVFKFISIKEYVYYRLTGIFLVDYSIASATGIFDSKNLTWSQKALEFAGITEKHLGEPVSPYHRVETSTSIGKDLGFKRNLAVVIGASDGCLAALGAAPLKEGNISLSIGTSAALRSFVSDYLPDPKSRLFTYLLDEQHFITGAPSNSAGAVFAWLTQLFSGKGIGFTDFAAFNSIASTIPAGSEGLCFIPYVLGERAPIWDAEATGSFSGIRNIHTRAHFARAAMEGILYNLRYILEILKERIVISDIFAGGGLITFPIWRQTLATILNKPLNYQLSKEDSSAGAAIIGMKAMGIIPSITVQSIFYKPMPAVVPEESMTEQYNYLYQQFKNTVNQI